ncbi:MAG: hypothetical protein JWR10_585 [Rubritepida sp.]|nr:hypothetical protein [Rubritepida sp.]
MKIALAGSLSLVLLSGCSSLGLDFSRMRGGEAPAPQAAGQPETLYLDLITGLRGRGLHRAALAHLDEYERLYERTPATLLLRGQSLLDIRDDAAALEVFRQITSGPEAAAAQAGIGTAAARIERWDLAVEAFTEAVRREPTNPRYLNNLGYALLRSGNAREGEFRLRMAGELDPNSAEIRNNLALLLLATSRRPDGERLLALMPSAEARAALRREAAQIQNPPERRS